MHDARDRNAGAWIEHSDRLYIAAYSSVASLVVQFSGYYRKADGEIAEYRETITPTSDRVVTAKTIFFGAGFLLSCVASLASGTADRGQCYVRAQVQRGEGGSTVKLHNLVGGYVTDDYSPSFPYGKVEGPLDGQGNFRSILGADPAAGAEVLEAVPAGAVWRILATRFLLVTSVNGVDRLVSFMADDGTNFFFISPPGPVQIANKTYNHIASHLGAGSTDIFHVVSIMIPPKLVLPAGYRLGTFTSNLEPDDNYGAPRIYVEEWIQA